MRALQEKQTAPPNAGSPVSFLDLSSSFSTRICTPRDTQRIPNYWRCILLRNETSRHCIGAQTAERKMSWSSSQVDEVKGCRTKSVVVLIGIDGQTVVSDAAVVVVVRLATSSRFATSNDSIHSIHRERVVPYCTS
jgi:hypothetical protein